MRRPVNPDKLADNPTDRKMNLYRTHSKRMLAVMMLIGLLGCSSSPVPTAVEIPLTSAVNSQIASLLEAARNSSGNESIELSLSAIDAMLDDGQFTRAENQIGLLQSQLQSQQQPSSTQLLRISISLAQISLQAGNAKASIDQLAAIRTEIQQLPASGELVRNYYQNLGDALFADGQHADAVTNYSRATDSSNPDPQTHQKIWEILNQFSNQELSDLASSSNNYQTRGWVELLRVVRSDQFSVKKQLDSVSNWRRTWSQHAATQLMPSAISELDEVWEQRPRHIALILPLQLSAGNAIQEGFLSAYYQDLAVSREVPHISVYDSSNALSIIPLYNQAVAAGADLVIGPLDKTLVTELSELEQLPVRTLALNYTEEESLETPPGLIQFGLAPEDEIEQATDLAWSSGFRNAAIITPDSEDYLRFQSIFQSIWTEKGGELVSQTSYNGNTDYAAVIKRLVAIDSSEARASQLLDILPRNNMEFTPRRRKDIDFIFMIANPRQGRQIKPTLAFYFAGDIPVYSLPSVYDGLENPGADQDLDGIVFTDAPWILRDEDPLKAEVASALRPVSGPLTRLRALGIDSYRLYVHLERLDDHKIGNLNGATGILSISENGRIRRRLAVARFENGLAVVSEDEISDSD